MNYFFEADKSKVQTMLMASAVVPVFLYSLLLLFKGGTIFLSITFFLCALAVSLLICKCYLATVSYDVYLTNDYLSGPSPFLGKRTKCLLKDVETTSITFKRRYMKIHKITVHAATGKRIALYPAIIGRRKTDIILKAIGAAQ